MPSPKELAKALAYQGEIRNQPRNRFLGGVADFLAPVSEFADRDKLPGSIPLLGGMSFADLSGLKGAQSLIEDMSYGKSPVRGATLNTAKVDPRLLDLAAVSGAMIPVGKALGKAALKKAAEQVQNRIGIARYMPDTRMGVVPEGASMPQRPKTEFEILHDTAQRNAALPKEQGGLGLPSGNTAMDRAGAMGFDTPAYHGTNVDLKEFIPSKNGRFGEGIYTTNNPLDANGHAYKSFSMEEPSNVMPLLTQKPDLEYAGGAINVINKPADIRSRFAAFDPMRRHEADILAGVGVGGMLDPQAIAEALRQQDRK